MMGWLSQEANQKDFICSKGHRVRVEADGFIFSFYCGNELVAKTRQLCPICLAEFMDGNISELVEDKEGE